MPCFSFAPYCTSFFDFYLLWELCCHDSWWLVLHYYLNWTILGSRTLIFIFLFSLLLFIFQKTGCSTNSLQFLYFINCQLFAGSIYLRWIYIDFSLQITNLGIEDHTNFLLIENIFVEIFTFHSRTFVNGLRLLLKPITISCYLANHHIYFWINLWMHFCLPSENFSAS